MVSTVSDGPAETSKDTRRAVPISLLVLGLMLVAANMRAAITCVGPLLGQIRDDVGLSASQAGLLGTLPLLAFGTISAVVPKVTRKLGFERVVLWSLTALFLGTVIRSLPNTLALFSGTTILGGAIAFMNVLLPGLIARDFRSHFGAMTAIYVTTMGLTAAISSGVAVPIAQASPGGWRMALGCWAALALIGVVAWLPQLGTETRADAAAAPSRIWRSLLAWQLTAFIGLQSFGFYTVVTWLPSILQTHGYSGETAGWQLFAYLLASLIGSALAPGLASAMHDQRKITGISAAIGVVGLAGLVWVPSLATAWAFVAGGGSGANFSLALSFFGLRAHNATQAAALSGMAQSVGYLFAAMGPFVIGLLHDTTRTWTIPLLVMVAAGILQFVAGLGAGRDRKLAPAKGVEA